MKSSSRTLISSVIISRTVGLPKFPCSIMPVFNKIDGIKSNLMSAMNAMVVYTAYCPWAEYINKVIINPFEHHHKPSITQIMSRKHRHKSHRSNWLRAAVLGANDGIVSTASLIVGVASAGSSSTAVIVAGCAGLVAGACSMAAGEYVSVSSQADTERADLALEKKSLAEDFDYELRELTVIYQRRGLTKELAKEVAKQLMAHDALGAHARDEIGITDTSAARPIQAAFVSAAAFTAGAGAPVLLSLFVPLQQLVWAVGIFCLILLATLGALAAKIGGAPVFRGGLRVVLWGAIAMVATATIGNLFDVTV